MNREIKFRWVGVSEGETTARPHAVLGIHWGAMVVELEEDPGCTYALENGTLEQFTGLKDKNGTDIYEGDILDFGIKPVAVEWSIKNERETYGQGSYGESVRAGFYFDGYWGLPEKAVVVGNIHQHQELLK